MGTYVRTDSKGSVKRGITVGFLFLAVFLAFVVLVTGQAYADSLTKTVAITNDTPPVGQYNPGDEITYTIDYSFTVPINDMGTSTMTDTLPAGLTLVNRTNSTEFNQSLWNGTTLTWNNTAAPLNFAAGTYSGTVIVVATIDAGVVPGTTITNTACLDSDTITIPADLPAPTQGDISPQALTTTCGSVQFTTSVPAVPTMTEWGMILFVVLAGLTSLYFIRRKRNA